jgi:SAM-dependent methyltransferase
VDVGCGTGALCETAANRCRPASVAGVEPSHAFLAEAEERLAGRVALHHGDASALPLDDASVDVAVSGLVLNFVRDPRWALAEMRRVTRRGGRIATYVWDYAGKMDLIRTFWDAATELDGDAAGLDEGVRFPLCHPDALAHLFEDAGLARVEAVAIAISMPFASFDEYWEPFLGGQGPAPAYAMSLDVQARGRLRDRLRERLPIHDDGTLLLMARAWAVRADVPG